MTVVDLSSQISLISLFLLSTSSNLPQAVLASNYRNMDSRFGNTTYQEIDLDLEVEVEVEVDEGCKNASLSMHLLPAGSEIQIPNGDERGDMAVVVSVMCVLQHADNIVGADSNNSYPLLKMVIRSAVNSLFRSDYNDFIVRESADVAVDPSLSKSLPAHINVMLGKGSVGSAWWDSVR